MFLTHVKLERKENVDILLNDLIKINNDRIACYSQILDKVKKIDYDLETIFTEIITDSSHYTMQLQEKLVETNGETENNACKLSGLIHRAWADLKVTFIGSTRIAIITFCEYNEQVAQQAYSAALSMSGELDADIRKIIEEQHQCLQGIFDRIRKCRSFTRPFNSGFLEII